MAAYETFANDPSTTVSSGGTTAPVSGTVETWTVASSASFPAASTGTSQFHVADTNPALAYELIAVTNVSGTTWTVTRGAESTTPVAHTAGFTVQQVTSAGGLGTFAQAGHGDLGGTGQAPTVTSTHLTAALPVAQGGTGQTTQQAAIDALAGATTSGDYLRGTGSHMVVAAIQAGDLPAIPGAKLGLQPSGDTSGAADTAAIASLMSAAVAGSLILLGEGIFYLNGPVVPLSGVRLQGTKGSSSAGADGFTSSSPAGTILQPVAGWSTSYNTSGVITLPSGSVGTHIRDIWIAGLSTPSGSTGPAGLDGICTNGSGASAVYLQNVGSVWNTGNGIACYAGGGWHMATCYAGNNLGHGVVCQAADSVFVNVHAQANGQSGTTGDGFYGISADTRLIGCRADLNQNGFTVNAADGAGFLSSVILTGCGTQRNNFNGLNVINSNSVGNGNRDPVIVSGCSFMGDGQNGTNSPNGITGGTGGGGYAGVAVAGRNVVQMDSSNVLVGTVDVAGGCPQYGIATAVTGSGNTAPTLVQVTSGVLNAVTAAINDAASIGIGTGILVSPSVQQATGSQYYGATRSLLQALPVAQGGTGQGTSAPALLSGAAFSGAVSTSTNFVATGFVQGNRLLATGLTGATAASRYAGATASGAPVSGTFSTGDFVIDQTGNIWVCTTGGTPGTWAKVGPGGTVTVGQGGTGLQSLTAYELIAGGTASATAVQQVGLGSAGQFLGSNGAGSLPSMQALPAAGTASAGVVQFPVGVPGGGTGLTSLTAWELVTGGTSSAAAVQQVPLGTTGWVLTSGGAGTMPSMQALPNAGTATAGLVTFPVTAAQGGTGLTSLTAYELLAAGTSSVSGVQQIGLGTAGTWLASNGAGALPSMQALPSAGTASAGLVTFDRTASRYQPLGSASAGGVTATLAAYSDHAHPYEPWQFYVGAYGAKGDGRIVGDGAMSSSVNPTFLTSATAAFTAADVGKNIVVNGALGASNAPLYTTVASVTNSTTAVLNASATNTVSAAAVFLASDDSAAIVAAVTAASTWAQAGTWKAQVVFDAKFYGLATLTTTSATGSTAQQNALVPIPYPNVNGTTQKLNIEFAGVGESADEQYFDSTIPSMTGTALVATVAASGTAPSIIGGPNASTNLTGTWANTKFTARGITVWAGFNPGWIGWDLRQCSACWLDNAGAQALAPNGGGQNPGLGTIPVNTSGIGVIFPSNNDNGAGRLMVEGFYYGAQVAPRTTIEKLFTNSNAIGVLAKTVNSTVVHGARIGYWSLQACTTAIASIGTSGTMPLVIDLYDSAGTITTDLSDAHGTIVGSMNWWHTVSTAPTVVAGFAMRIVNLRVGPGPVSSPPSAPSSGSASTAIFRDTQVTLSVTGGAMSALTIDAVDQHIPAGCVLWALTVPSGHTFTPTYTGVLANDVTVM